MNSRQAVLHEVRKLLSSAELRHVGDVETQLSGDEFTSRLPYLLRNGQ